MSLEKTIPDSYGNGIPRRDFLKGGAYAGLGVLGLSQLFGCATLKPVRDTLHNAVSDYDISVLDDKTGKVYTMRGKVDSQGEEEAYKILTAHRANIESRLKDYLGEEDLKRFSKRLYDEKDANRAGALLYHHINDKDREASKKVEEALGIKAGAYPDAVNIAAIVVGALTIAAFAYQAAAGTGVFGGGGSGGPVGGGGGG